ncbi:MAG: urease accessory protein UreF [Alphaproteobacteria bacterium]|nr:urease accessory protein UreF [Alphaproteobacteria bacterium]
MPAARTLTPVRDPEGTAPATRERGINPRLYRLLAWLSPGFPVGSFSFSHGLEALVDSGAVRDRTSLEHWVGAVVVSGSGRIDADIVREAHRAAAAGDVDLLTDANLRGIGFRGTAETRVEATAQGEAFLAACRGAWPEPFLDHWATRLEKSDMPVCYAAAVGAATARAGIPLRWALTGYLQAMAANLVSAGLRLGTIGQTDGQRVLAALEPLIDTAVIGTLARDPGSFGSATFATELASIAHETLHTRLFRS